MNKAAMNFRVLRGPSTLICVTPSSAALVANAAIGPEQLDGQLAIEDRIVGGENHAHAAPADALEDEVAAEPRPRPPLRWIEDHGSIEHKLRRYLRRYPRDPKLAERKRRDALNAAERGRHVEAMVRAWTALAFNLALQAHAAEADTAAEHAAAILAGNGGNRALEAQLWNREMTLIEHDDA
jgi:hypothetical protein